MRMYPRRWRQRRKAAAFRRQSDAHSTPAVGAPFGTLAVNTTQTQKRNKTEENSIQTRGVANIKNEFVQIRYMETSYIAVQSRLTCVSAFSSVRSHIESCNEILSYYLQHSQMHTIVDDRIQPIIVHAHERAERLELAQIAKVETVNVQTVRPLGSVRLLRKL